MWSLYEIDKNGENEKHRTLDPLKFSNGKNQEDIVKEVLDSISEGHKIIFIRGVCGTGKCIDKESLIFCKPSNSKYFRHYKISSLVGKNGKIVSLDKKGNLIESKFTNVRKTGRKKLYKLKTRTGRDMIASSNHPFLTITKKGTEWVPLKRLNEKSYICLPNQINLEENANLDENKIKILAHLIAEGKLGDKSGSPKYYQCADQNPEIRKDYIDSLKSLFKNGEIKERGKEITIKFGLMDTRFGTTNKLRLFIREYGLDGKKSANKFIPEIIFNLDKKKIALFLSRLFSCDGSIYQRGKHKQIVVEYCSISKRLVQDISILLHRFGIQHTITSKKFQNNQNYAWRISISNHEQLRKYIQNIGFIGRKQKLALELLNKTKEHKFTNIDKVPRIIKKYLKGLGYNYTELDRFLNYDEIENLRKDKGFKKIRADKNVKTPFVFNQQKIDFLRSHIQKINEHIKDDTLSFICNNQIVWDKIKSVDYLKIDETYDLEVSEHHNFIVNGIIVHNSAIALNIAKELGKTSIVVPGKNLQAQYKKDYEKDKYLLGKDGKKMKISVITGRGNHPCCFLQNNGVIPKIKREINASLSDIFEFDEEEEEKRMLKDKSANVYDLPCKIELKEKSWKKLKEYIRQNDKVDPSNFLEIKDVTRASVAAACPYWSPVLPEKFELKSFPDSTKTSYLGLNNTKFIIHKGKPGCKFYEQFDSYLESDVIVFNSMKYILETALDRKPATEIEVIDECDEFLDSFSNNRKINVDKLQTSLVYAMGFGEHFDQSIKAIAEITQELKVNERVNDAIVSGGIIPLKETGVYDLLKVFINTPEFLSEVDNENYLLETEETAKMFEDFLEESYVTFHKKDNALIASVVTINLAKKFKEMIDKNKRFVLMSGTLHSEEVLKNIFGLDDFKIIEAETMQQGQIEILRTGLEKDCKYANFSRGKVTREDYLHSLDKCVEMSKKPTLVHINAFRDLPDSREIQEFNLKNLMDREKLKEIQGEDNEGRLISEFKKGETDVLFSTRAARGIDFPGEQCRSIIFTKYPNPNVKDAFWKILNEVNPQNYWSFYKDKAKRELLQKIYRGLRFKEDHIYLLSPDSRVLEAFEKIASE